MKKREYIINIVILLLLSIVICCAALLRRGTKESTPQETTTAPARVATATPIITITVKAPQETTPEETTTAEAFCYIDCPLSEEIQQEIYDICAYYELPFCWVMAVIKCESGFRSDAIGDNGNSKGLMQIQEKWHSGLMEELGVNNLLDPIDNVKVGVALLNSFFDEKKDFYYALMKYNGGGAYANRKYEAGEVSGYAVRVMQAAEEYAEQIN